MYHVLCVQAVVLLSLGRHTEAKQQLAHISTATITNTIAPTTDKHTPSKQSLSNTGSLASTSRMNTHNMTSSNAQVTTNIATTIQSGPRSAVSTLR